MGDANMTDKAGAEEALLAGNRPVNELIHNDKITRRHLFPK